MSVGVLMCLGVGGLLFVCMCEPVCPSVCASERIACACVHVLHPPLSNNGSVCFTLQTLGPRSKKQEVNANSRLHSDRTRRRDKKAAGLWGSCAAVELLTNITGPAA